MNKRQFYDEIEEAEENLRNIARKDKQGERGDV